MGWNKGYSIMEKQVVGLYDLEILTKDVLEVIMEPFCNSDIDSGGSNNLKAKDGKTAEDIICFIMEPEKYQEVVKNFIPDPEEPDWNEGLYDLYNKIVREKWGIW